MFSENFQLLLADDDLDDCLFFKEALEELQIGAQLSTVRDGEQLMQLLTKRIEALPAILFLDLNMPRKNGLECLGEIRNNEKLSELPVVIFSTSYEPEMVNLLYKSGAQFYIRKPADFSQLKKVIHQALILSALNQNLHPPKENFVLTGESKLI